MLVIIWTAVILAAFMLLYRQKYSRFSRYGVKYTRPLPILGNLGRILFRLDHITDELERTYNAFPEERFVGRFEFTVPMLIIRDRELLKKITVKDFEYFVDRRAVIDNRSDPVFGRNLLALKGQDWKDMRSTLSPAFTSSKMRIMIPFMVEVGNQMMLTLKDKINKSRVDFIDVEVKDLTSRYANDVIASCAFGLKVNSHADEDNEFYNLGKEATTFSFLRVLKFFVFLAFPKLMAKFKYTLFPKSITGVLRSIILDTMYNREIKNIIRPDMIHLLMEAKKGKLSHDEKSEQDVDTGFATAEESSVGKKKINRVWSDDDLVAQAILFFIAGFESVSSAMTFAIHELALNPDIQERLYEEIKENNFKNGGKFDYKSIQEMTYMDMVVSEVLRLWPATIVVDRQCTQDYNLGKPNDNAVEDYIIQKGEIIGISNWVYHRDPELFPNPLKFDPERFSEENKHNIKPFTYMPFGVGPRNCIASRFALCEVKVMIYQLLQHMVISPCEKTCRTMELDRASFNLRLKGGHWARLKIRN